MTKDEAEKILVKAFKPSYNEEKFREFIKNFLIKHEHVNKTKIVPVAFKKYILSYKRLAKFKDAQQNEIDVLAVKVKKARTLESARTMQRNLIARYLNGSHGKLKDAALVVFYSDETLSWRFSLVYMDYVLDKDSHNIKSEFTPARRYSFLIEGDPTNHTLRQQLLPVLISGKPTTLADLKTAFSVEPVTEEFFKKYKTLYEDLKKELDKECSQNGKVKQEFDKCKIETDDFAKRLLGQIVFLYFLQKKGWLGVKKGKDWGTGPKDFLLSLFNEDYVEYNNFFKEVLNPIFYEALATERTDNYYAHLDCRIPFLNGGLFEPIGKYDWVNIDILIANNIFKEIFETFDTYNFTVREDEPLEKEVAIDPEMLGKVFEKLIPENERKGNSAYYTPREIVHYMCQESLINYLDVELNVKPKSEYSSLVPREDIETFIRYGDSVSEHEDIALQREQDKTPTRVYNHKISKNIRKYASNIDKALADVKICDPAIGSGAFPVGMMTEIIRARDVLNHYVKEKETRARYDFKWRAIESSIYGVDIERSAVDIAKLRLWLSLVVDEEDFKAIRPLPNLDYKIVVGDTLTGIYNKDQFYKDPSEKKDRFIYKELVKLKDQKTSYFIESSPKKKTDLKKDIDATLSILTKGRKLFDCKVNFSEVFDEKNGFDIVLGNPPYLKEANNKSRFDDLKNLKWRDYYKGKMDIWYAFGCIALDICNENGTHSFIATNNWVTSEGAKLLIDKVMEEAIVMNFIDFVDVKIFKEASIQTMVYVLSKTKSLERELIYVNFTGLKDEKIAFREIDKLPNTKYKKQVSLDYSATGNSTYKSIRFLTSDILKLKKKILSENVGYFNRDFNSLEERRSSNDDKKAEEIGNGIDISQDFVSKKNADKLSTKGIKKDDGVFVLTRKEMSNLKPTPKEKKYLRPFYKGNEIKRYKIPSNKYWIIYADEYFRNNIDKFSNLKKHLGKFSSIITSVNKPYGLHSPRKEQFFDDKKILSLRKTKIPIFAYANKSTYVSRPYLIIQLNSWEESYYYVTGILNSRLIYFWLYTFGKRQGEQLQVDKNPLLSIPVRKINFSDSKEEKAHDTIKGYVEGLYQDSSNPEAVKKVEEKIDKIVYGLYGLTPKEVGFIEDWYKERSK